MEQSGKIYEINGTEVHARKKTNNQWFETQDSISYWDDFNQQKIVYREISDAMNGCIVDSDFILNNKCYFITGEHLIYLLSYLNSKLFTKIILPQVNTTGGKGEEFLNSITAIRPTEEIEKKFLYLYKSRMENQANVDLEIDSLFCKLYELSNDEEKYILAD